MMSVNEGNKKIAVWMGVPAPAKIFGDWENQLLPPIGGPELKYHSDWNWLMEVVEKIRLSGKIVTIEFFDEEVVCQIRHSADSLMADFSGCNESNTKEPIQAVYAAVLGFIEWWEEKGRA